MTIHVGNLSPATSLSELRGCFEIFGKVSDVTISAFTVCGVARGCGQVEMLLDDHAQAAISGLQSKTLDGNLLKVTKG